MQFLDGFLVHSDPSSADLAEYCISVCDVHIVWLVPILVAQSELYQNFPHASPENGELLRTQCKGPELAVGKAF